VEVVGFEPTQLKNTCFTDKPDSPTSACFHNLSGKQDSNLQPPASNAGKQPIVIFPVLNLAAHTRIELVAPERQSGRLTFTTMSQFPF
jgi:hypothetical protein